MMTMFCQKENINKEIKILKKNEMEIMELKIQ